MSAVLSAHFAPSFALLLHVALRYRVRSLAATKALDKSTWQP
jgi:hypothetical protein